MSIQNDINAFEKVNNMKNMLGGSFIEFLKPNIKAKQNESVLKMLELAKEKPETYLELLAVAIFHQNIEIIKYMITNFKIDEADSPYMKASSFYNSILSEDSKDKINDSKDYKDIQIPFVLMCGIGGDIEIFKYLLENKLISKKNQNGIIGLSKKFKNSFSSNIVGACAYYGKKDLLEFLLKNYKNELELDIKSSEKKVKNSKFNFTKEFTGCTPCLLSMVAPISDMQTLEILKILHKYGANFTVTDCNKENLLHIATKNKKIESAKYIIDELNLKNLILQSNKDRYTPLSLAQHLNDEGFISYYSGKNEVDDKEIEENLRSLLIEDSANHALKQNKKSKKNKKKGKYNKSEKKEEENNENKANESQSKKEEINDNEKEKKKEEKKKRKKKKIKKKKKKKKKKKMKKLKRKKKMKKKKK